MVEVSSDVIQVIHVDDEPDFAKMAAEFLCQQDVRFEVETFTSASDALDHLRENTVHCIVSDFDMPGQNGLELLRVVREEYLDLPFILYTGKGSEEIASDAISAGVTDYLQKEAGTSQYTVLANRIENAVEQYRAEEELTSREQELQLFFEQSPLGVIQWDDQFDVARVNGMAEELLGYTEEELVGESWEMIVPESDLESVDTVVSSLLEAEGGYRSVNENVRKDGERIVCEWHNRVVTDEDDEVVAIFSQFQDITERRQQQQDLQHQAKRFETFNIAFPDLAFILDENGRFLDVIVGEKSEDLLYEEPSTFIGQTVDEVLPDDILNPIQEVVQLVLDTGESQRFEYSLDLPQGERWFEAILEPLPFEFDGSKAILWVARDITERQRRKREIDRQRSLLKAQQEAFLDGILVVDENGNIASYNDRFVSMWDLPEEVVERGDDEAALAEVTDQLADPGEFHEKVEYLYDHPEETARDEISLADGRVFDRYTSPLSGKGGTYFGRLWTFRDITERLERERELEQYETIVDTVPVGVFVLDEEGIVVEGNARAAEILGYEADHLIGESIQQLVEDDVFDQDVVDTCAEYVRTLLSADTDTQSASFESAVRVLGEERIIEVNMALRPFEEEYRGTIGVIQDVTKVRRQAHEIHRQNQQLQSFSSVVSHDLRNPLNVAAGRLEIAQGEWDSEHLDIARQALGRMEDLIDDTLTLARVGEAVGEMEAVSLSELSEACWGTVDTPKASLKTDSTAIVLADESRLRQLVENLFRNAVEHGGDAVTVRVGDLADGFYIEDDGPGISADERNRVFDAGYSTSEGGTGFGLNIVKEIVEAHGWKISLTESDAGGVRFEFTGVEFVES